MMNLRQDELICLTQKGVNNSAETCAQVSTIWIIHSNCYSPERQFYKHSTFACCLLIQSVWCNDVWISWTGNVPYNKGRNGMSSFLSPGITKHIIMNSSETHAVNQWSLRHEDTVAQVLVFGNQGSRQRTGRKVRGSHHPGLTSDLLPSSRAARVSAAQLSQLWSREYNTRLALCND